MTIQKNDKYIDNENNMNKYIQLYVKTKQTPKFNEIIRSHLSKYHTEIILNLLPKRNFCWRKCLLSMNINYSEITFEDFCILIDCFCIIRVWSKFTANSPYLELFEDLGYLNLAIETLSKYNKPYLIKPDYLPKSGIYFIPVSINGLTSYGNNIILLKNGISATISYVPNDLDYMICNICYVQIASIRLACFENNKYGHRLCKSCYTLLYQCPYCKKSIRLYNKDDLALFWKLIIGMYLGSIFVCLESEQNLYSLLKFTIGYLIITLLFLFHLLFSHRGKIGHLSQKTIAKYEKYLIYKDIL